MNTLDVINYYHDLLTDEIAEETDSIMRQKLRERNLYFGARPLCVVLRPHFYRLQDWLYMKQGLEQLLRAFSKAHDAFMTEAKYREKLFLEPWEEEFYSVDIGAPPPWTSSRLDTFFVTQQQRSLMCVEYNAETPAGIGYNDNLADVFDQLKPMKHMHKKYNMYTTRSLKTLRDALVDAYVGWGGTNNPQIAIVDWQDVPTLNEHEITRQYFEANGIPSILADPRALEYKDGYLWKGDFRIDIIYKRVLYSELVEQMGTNNAILNAVKDRAVFMTNSPSAKMLSKKASLAFLSDEQNAHLFTAQELYAIHEHIPWSRMVSDRKTTYGGKLVDLLSFVEHNRERFVLKPNDDYGGKGVVLGWDCSPSGWKSTLEQALNSPYVVQEKVPTEKNPFPSWINGNLEIADRYVDADPYIFNGTTVFGCLTRLSPLAILNVTAGGGSVVPLYIVSEK